jgi:hypothetical protein
MYFFVVLVVHCDIYKSSLKILNLNLFKLRRFKAAFQAGSGSTRLLLQQLRSQRKEDGGLRPATGAGKSMGPYLKIKLKAKGVGL